MTTPDNSPHEGSSAFVPPSLTGLAILNMAIALIIVLAQSTTLNVLAFANEADEGLGKTTLVFPYIVVVLAIAAATISIWHSSIAESRDTLKKSPRNDLLDTHFRDAGLRSDIDHLNVGCGVSALTTPSDPLPRFQGATSENGVAES